MICMFKAIQYDLFEIFRNMCIKIYELDPAKFLSAPGLAWQVTLKKTKVKLYFLTDINMLLMVEKGIRGGMCHFIINDLYGWAISQKLPVNNFQWIKDTSQFNGNFVKKYNEESHNFSNLIFNILLILELSKKFMYESWYDYVKPMMFIKKLHKILKLDLILQIRKTITKRKK